MDNQEKPEKPPPGVLFEDLVQYANQYTGGAHPTGRDVGSKKLTVLDLLRMGNEQDDQAPKMLPHQMSSFIDNLGDVYIKLLELQQQVASAYKSNITKDTVKIKQRLVNVNKNLEKQKKLVKECGKLIDKLSH